MAQADQGMRFTARASTGFLFDLDVSDHRDNIHSLKTRELFFIDVITRINYSEPLFRIQTKLCSIFASFDHGPRTLFIADSDGPLHQERCCTLSLARRISS